MGRPYIRILVTKSRRKEEYKKHNHHQNIADVIVVGKCHGEC